MGLEVDQCEGWSEVFCEVDREQRRVSVVFVVSRDGGACLAVPGAGWSWSWDKVLLCSFHVADPLTFVRRTLTGGRL